MTNIRKLPDEEVLSQEIKDTFLKLKCIAGRFEQQFKNDSTLSNEQKQRYTQAAFVQAAFHAGEDLSHPQKTSAGNLRQEVQVLANMIEMVEKKYPGNVSQIIADGLRDAQKQLAAPRR